MKPARYKPKQVEIAESDPFKDDLLDRRNSADVLTEFVGTLTGYVHKKIEMAHRFVKPE